MATVITPRRLRPSTTAAPHSRTAVRPGAPPDISKEDLLTLVRKDILDLAAISELTGVRERSLSIYHNRGSMPKPDVRKGQAPLWHRETIESWDATRRTRTNTAAKAK